MSQTSANAAEATKAKDAKAKVTFAKAVTEQSATQIIDPVYIILALKQMGVTYTPVSYQGVAARAALTEDVKLFISNLYRQSGIDANEDEDAINTINTLFETALIKSNPYAAVYAGLVSQERVQEIMTNVGGMFGGIQGGFSPYGQMGFGAQMPFGAQQFGGMPFGGAQQAPIFGKKTEDASKQAPKSPFGMPQQAAFGGMPFGGGVQFGGMPFGAQMPFGVQQFGGMPFGGGVQFGAPQMPGFGGQGW